MPTKNNYQKVLKTSVEITGHTLRILLAVVVAYVVITMIFLAIQQKDAFLVNIATWSMGGFWAFFMGYFGWMIAESITKTFFKKNK